MFFVNVRIQKWTEIQRLPYSGWFQFHPTFKFVNVSKQTPIASLEDHFSVALERSVALFIHQNSNESPLSTAKVSSIVTMRTSKFIPTWLVHYSLVESRQKWSRFNHKPFLLPIYIFCIALQLCSTHFFYIIIHQQSMTARNNNHSYLLYMPAIVDCVYPTITSVVLLGNRQNLTLLPLPCEAEVSPT